MYVETVPNRDSPPAILLREGWREGNKTRKRTLANLSDWPPHKIRNLAPPAARRNSGSLPRDPTTVADQVEKLRSSFSCRVWCWWATAGC